MTTAYHHWTPDTGTVEMPAVRRGVPLADLPTEPIAFWRPRPSVPTTHYTPRARLRHRWARMMASPFMADIRTYASFAFWPMMLMVGLFLGFYLRDQALTWQGLIDVRPGGVQ